MPSLLPASPGARRRTILALRGLGYAVALALGAIALLLLVTSKNQKHLELGVLAGVWGAALMWFSTVFAARPAPATYVDVQPGTAVDVRAAGRVARVDDLDVQQFRAQLEELVRSELRTGLARELAGLKAEVEELRSELVEKVGGQLRLERIETTRLIGSDLEALQQEVRQLKVRQWAVGQSSEFEELRPRPRADELPAARVVAAPAEPAIGAAVETAVETAVESRAPRGHAGGVRPVAATVAPAGVPIPTRLADVPSRPESVAGSAGSAGAAAAWSPARTSAPPPSAAVSSAPPAASSPAASSPAASVPAASAPVQPVSPAQAARATQPAPPVQPAQPSAPAARAGDDPLAGLPRLTPFSEPDVPVDDAPRSTAPSVATAPAVSAAAAAGRHSSRPNGPTPSGGRRHRTEDSEDLLAQILKRERS